MIRKLIFILLFIAGTAWGLDWKDGAHYRSAELPVPKTGKTGFTRLASEATGIWFTNHLSQDRSLTNQIFLNGSGVAAGDVDGDGWCDLYFCGLDGANRLYRNLGQWKFEELTDSAGVSCPGLDCTGAAFADLDGDSDLDLVVNTIGAGTHLFINNGAGRFHQPPNFSPLNQRKGGTSLALADIDGDGFLDLYIANYRVSGLLDMPNARFWLKVVNGKQVVASVDGRPVTEPDLANRFLVNSRGGIDELGEADALYRSEGGANFVHVSFTGGAFMDEKGQPLATPPFDWGLSAMFYDLNGDTEPDLYICNDFDSPDRIWINLGRGRFRAIDPLAIRKLSLFSMGVDFADINRDGHDDFVVLDMLSRDHSQRMTTQLDRKLPLAAVGEIQNRTQHSLNTLFISRGDGTYAETAFLSGVSATEWSWTPIFLDVDLDGWEDLLVSNGHERDARNIDVAEILKKMRTDRQMSRIEILQARKLFPRLATTNLAFRNQRDLTFKEVSAEWGFGAAEVSHGMALADLDNDGDADLVMNNLNGPAGIYRNEAMAPRVAVRLKGRPPNTRGIGAKIRLLGGPVTQSQEMICGGRYLSSDDPMRAFAVGAGKQMAIEVQWRSGKWNVINGVKPNHLYEIKETNGSVVSAQPAGEKSESAVVRGQSAVAGNIKSNIPQRHNHRQPATDNRPGTTDNQPLFEDASALLNHIHQDEAFDDFARQPLLPNRLSQLGPGISWLDLDNDGWDDLIIGGGRGGQMGVYRNNKRGGFERQIGGPIAQPVTRDQTTILDWRRSNGTVGLLAGSANYEDGLDLGSVVRLYDFQSNKVVDSFPGQLTSTGPLAMADIDLDGDLDLFVGGRVVPGKYPSPGSSLLFRNETGQWVLDEQSNRIFHRIGLISGAVFSDLNSDGAPDLVLACDWGPVRVFRNRAAQFEDITTGLGLHQYRGWWNGVAAGDFDGDGRMDLVASNWGRNTKYEMVRQQPLRVYFGDFDHNQVFDLMETYVDPDNGKRVAARQLGSLARGLPFLLSRYATHAAFAAAAVEEILRIASTDILEVNWLESTLFLNRGNSFEARFLPVEAQMAPAFGIAVGDLDGDTHEDIFLAQNFFAAQPETPRYDAGRGLLLKGDGLGGFTAVAGHDSGIQIYGEGRGCALADYDGDGRVDLAVAQNGAQTKLYRNRGAAEGIRVRLVGPAGNPNGVGAVIRMTYGRRQGPAREILGGTGYWSQNGVVQVMGRVGDPQSLWVRWPGGRSMTVALPAEARNVSVDQSGQVRLLR